MLVVPNFARTTLRAAITPASTQLQLASGGGAYFAIGTGNYMYITVEDGTSVEIMKFTNTGSIVNDTIVVERGQDGTTAKSFPAGACVKVAWNVAQVQEMVTQTFINLFDTSAIPPNTVQVSAPPVAAPPNNVIYAIWHLQRRFWYWTGASWVEIGNPRYGVLAGSGDPSGTPDSIVAFYVNTNNGELWYWTSSAWMSVAGGSGSTEEYWVRGAQGSGLYVLSPNTQVELGVISMTDRYRTYPNGVAANTILQVINQGGNPRTTMLEDGAIEVTVTVRGNFGSNPVPDAVMQMVISNSQGPALYGNSATINVNFLPEIVINATTGVLTFDAGTYFDGNLVYSGSGAGPWPNFNITQVNTAFHVVEAGVGP